jgi:hypothetical protein
VLDKNLNTMYNITIVHCITTGNPLPKHRRIK